MMGKESAGPSLEDLAQEICQHKSLEYSGRVDDGTFKETFKVIDSGGDLQALKIYKSLPDTRTDREIDSMLRCDHENIAKILAIDYFEQNGAQYLYLLEEFFSGGTLSERIETAGLLSREQLTVVARGLISAVSHIASHGLVHRDIKPQNILFRKDQEAPILTDFGIVRDLNADSETLSWLQSGPCTPQYGAPEQLRNEKRLIDWRTDQFAIGTTLSYAFLGFHPYDAGSGDVIDTINNVARRGPISQRFLDQITEANLVMLAPMVAQYPAQRVRTPDALLSSWN